MAEAKIVIVEDERVVALDIEESLTALGYQVQAVVSSGQEAIEAVERTRPNAVLMDIMLEGEMDGVTAAEQIRERFGVAVIYLTAYADDATLERAKVTEPYGYLLKPFDERELQITIEMALYKHRAEKLLQQHNRDLTLLSLAGQTISATLDPDQVLHRILNEARRLLDVETCSLWLVDAETGELVCREAPGPTGKIVRDWRLEFGVGLANWVYRHNEALSVPDTRQDPRHFKEIDRRTGVELRAILSVPLRVKQNAIGVLQMGNTEPNSFRSTHRALAESLAATAAAAIANAQLYEESERLRTFNENIVQGVAEAILLEDAEGTLTFVNPAAEELLGYSREELLGLRWIDLIPEEEQAEIRAQRAKWSRGKQSHFETVFQTKGGQKVAVIVGARPMAKNEQFTGTLLVCTDITERKRAEEEREKLIQELEAFSHTVAHDLKSPLHLIGGYASMLEEDYAIMSPAELEDFSQRIAHTARKMGDIVDNLLLLAQARKIDVAMKPLDMANIVEEAQNRLALQIKEREAQLVVPDDWPVALGHAPWIEEVWVNYISNAIKYGGDPPRVELGAVVDQDGMARFGVRDNGPGLSEEQMEKLFTPFTRLEQLRAEGHGLGLSIVHRIVKRLDGQVGVHSEQGKGSVFYFTLPLATDAQDPSQTSE